MTNPLPPTDSPAGIADDQIEELLRLEAEATPGDWRLFSQDVYHGTMILSDDGRESITICRHVASSNERHANANLIVAMRNAIKPLIERLKRAEADRETLREGYDEAFETAKRQFANMQSMRARADQLESERDRLKEALKPFAKALEIMETPDDEPDCTEYILSVCGLNDIPEITLGDLRRAAAALADKESNND